MAKKKVDPKAKAKRQKIFLAVGGVLLLGLLAFQVPRTMKMLKPQSQDSPSSTTATTSTTAGSTPLAPPTLGGSATAGAGGSGAAMSAASSATSADGVSDPSNPLPPNAGQLVSFSNFKSKDPFHQQITDCVTSASEDPAATSCASRSTTGSSKTGSIKTPSTIGVSAKPITNGSTSASVKVSKATISVNGIPSTVSVGSSFPAGTPVFTVVSLTRSAAKVGILGGSYESGAATVTLTKGKTVTLMNTADGTRYVLRLLAVE